MKNPTEISSKPVSKGSAIFQKIMEDKKAIQQHLAKGGKISDLEDKYPFVTPI